MLKWRKLMNQPMFAEDNGNHYEIVIEPGPGRHNDYALYVNGVRRMWTSSVKRAKGFAEEIRAGRK